MKTNTRQQTEGGWGWVVVFAGVIVYLIVFGSLRCQSVLFVPIVDEFNSDFSSVAWVSSIATAGFSVAGVLAAPLISRIGHRKTVILGGVTSAIGCCLASLSPTLVVLDLTAGLLTGAGLGIAFLPSPVIIGHYFKKRRSLATNIASVGASIGTLAICPLNQIMIESFTLRGYFLIFGSIILNICVAGALMRPPPATESLIIKEEPQKEGDDNEVIEQSCSQSIPVADRGKNKPNDGENKDNEETDEKTNQADEATKTQRKCCATCRNSPLFSNPPYIIYCISQVVFLAGFLGNQIYIVPYAELEVGIPRIQASLLLSIGAFVEIASRVLFGVLGDVKWIDRIWLFAGVLFVLSGFAAIFPLMKSFTSMAVVIGFAGLFQGGFSGISVVILADIVGLEKYATALGISTLLNGIGTLLTPPAIGWAVDQTKTPSTALFISAGILFLGAFLSAMIKVSLKMQQRKKNKHLASITSE